MSLCRLLFNQVPVNLIMMLIRLVCWIKYTREQRDIFLVCELPLSVIVPAKTEKDKQQLAMTNIRSNQLLRKCSRIIERNAAFTKEKKEQ